MRKLLVLILLVFASTNLSWAGEKWAEKEWTGEKTKLRQGFTESENTGFHAPKVAEQTELTQEFTGRETNDFPTMRVTERNGHYRAEGEITFPCVDSSPTYYEYRVDKEAGTYTIEKLKVPPREEEIPSALSGEASGTYSANPSLSTRDHTYEAIFLAENYLRTRDIPNWDITKTESGLIWGVWSDGKVDWVDWKVSWWCVEESPIGTHWFVYGKKDEGPYTNDSNTTAAKNIKAMYYNWDWLEDNKATVVYQYIETQGNNDATCTCRWTHYDAGESSWVLWGVLKTFCEQGGY